MLNDIIQAPPNRQPNTGLLALAALPEVEGQAWEGGFGFNPETCDDGLILEINCDTPDPEDDDKEVGDNPAAVSYIPGMLVGGFKCTTMSRVGDEQGRANRHLLTVESRLLERLLWTGEAANTVAPFDDRMHLADGNSTDIAAGAALDPRHGFALMDQRLTTCLHNVQGMIHMPPYALAVLAEANAVHYQGNRWLSPNGNIIVAGAGYTGQGPRATAADPLPAAPDFDAVTPPNDVWIYGTSLVNVLLGDRQDYADVDRSVNTRRIIQERAGAAFWGNCCQLAAQLDFTPPA